MKKHEISFGDVHGYTSKITFASAAGNGARKHLDAKVTFTANGPEAVYVVDSHCRVLYEGKSLADAVAAYNDA